MTPEEQFQLGLLLGGLGMLVLVIAVAVHFCRRS